MEVRRQQTIVLGSDATEIRMQSRHAAAPVGEQGQALASGRWDLRAPGQEADASLNVPGFRRVALDQEGGTAFSFWTGRDGRDETIIHWGTPQVQV